MTSGDRRLDKVEASLSPTELVVRWLAEAHALDDFTAYRQADIRLRRTELGEHAAVYVEHLAGDVARVVGRHERDDLRDFVRVAAATERNSLSPLAPRRLVLRGELLGHDRARPDGVHADTERREVERDLASE